MTIMGVKSSISDPGKDDRPIVVMLMLGIDRSITRRIVSALHLFPQDRFQLALYINAACWDRYLAESYKSRGVDVRMLLPRWVEAPAWSAIKFAHFLGGKARQGLGATMAKLCWRTGFLLYRILAFRLLARLKRRSAAVHVVNAPHAFMPLSRHCPTIVSLTGLPQLASARQINRLRAMSQLPGVWFDCLTDEIRREFAEFSPGCMARNPEFVSFDFSRARCGAKKQKVAFVGRFVPEKNPMMFLAALALLKEQRIAFEGIMLGYGPLQAQIEQFIAANQLPCRVAFVADPCEELQDTLISTGLQEATNYPSQALIEGMACGCATVAIDSGDTRICVSPELGTGLLVAATAESIAAGMIQLLQDPEKASEMGKAASRFVRLNMSLDAYCDYLNSLYSEAVDDWALKHRHATSAQEHALKG